MDASVKRWVGYGGLVFVVLVVVASFVAPNNPDTNATAAKVVSFYHQHQGAYYFNSYVIVAAIIVGLAYFWYLREYLAEATASGRLLTVAFAGAVVFAVSGGLQAGTKFALADASHSGNISGASMQTLNVLENDLSVPITAAGTATFLLFTGIVIIRKGGLPRWLGWVAVVLAILSAPGFVGGLPTGLWVLIASITLIVTNRNAASTRPSTPVATPASTATDS
ncbi:MAG TPA: hypothetical protein VLX59_14685 [Acidimicrobiales bacterium]|nr:hypothetical protein [Acidimicrobiales bacterium]